MGGGRGGMSPAGLIPMPAVGLLVGGAMGNPPKGIRSTTPTGWNASVALASLLRTRKVASTSATLFIKKMRKN